MPPYSSLSTKELVQRCADQDDSAAWQEFVRRFHRTIARVVLRIAYKRNATFPPIIDDLIQETYLKIFAGKSRILREFDHRHPDAFVGFVQVVAANVARDHFKSRSGTVHATLNETLESVVSSGNHGLGSAFALERRILLKEIEHLVDNCIDEPNKDRNRRIFWLYYRAGLSSAAIASLPGMRLTTKGIESILLRITRELRSKISRDRTNASRPTLEPAEGNASAGL